MDSVNSAATAASCNDQQTGWEFNLPTEASMEDGSDDSTIVSND